MATLFDSIRVRESIVDAMLNRLVRLECMSRCVPTQRVCIQLKKCEMPKTTTRLNRTAPIRVRIEKNGKPETKRDPTAGI